MHSRRVALTPEAARRLDPGGSTAPVGRCFDAGHQVPTRGRDEPTATPCLQARAVLWWKVCVVMASLLSLIDVVVVTPYHSPPPQGFEGVCAGEEQTASWFNRW